MPAGVLLRECGKQKESDQKRQQRFSQHRSSERACKQTSSNSEWPLALRMTAYSVRATPRRSPALPGDHAQFFPIHAVRSRCQNFSFHSRHQRSALHGLRNLYPARSNNVGAMSSKRAPSYSPLSGQLGAVRMNIPCWHGCSHRRRYLFPAHARPSVRRCRSSANKALRNKRSDREPHCAHCDRFLAA